ncbi:hypothetical protein GLOIN_2v1775288 [Rhizophagus irregularis DAOM 181602=DAOM 197198]|nr:hypothetical protein GLOIN_2v1775288 [Rhizophagus irregularis DAOM 181602=DAOM 197198]
MDKFGRCRIGSEVFSSALSFRHIKSSYVLAKFITTDGKVNCYPGQVQYYFKHEIDLPNGPTEHYLLLLGGTDQQTQQIFGIILVLMIPKKRKHAMLNYGKQIFFLKVGIVLFQYTTFFSDLCLLNIKFLLTAMQLNI